MKRESFSRDRFPDQDGLQGGTIYTTTVGDRRVTRCSHVQVNRVDFRLAAEGQERILITTAFTKAIAHLHLVRGLRLSKRLGRNV